MPKIAYNFKRATKTNKNATRYTVREPNQNKTQSRHLARLKQECFEPLPKNDGRGRRIRWSLR